MEKQILQKCIADSGYSSRRKAEEMIRNKKVTVNNKIAEPGQRVGAGDEIKINGKKIGLAKSHIYIKLNKPAGYVCTNRRFQGEKNIFDIIKLKEKLNAAGRLDKNSRGLVLITNDGELIQKITHPKFEHEKIYKVKIKNKKLKNDDIEKILFKFKRGINIEDGDGIVYTKEIKYLENNKFKIILTEGKKRQIRRMFKKIGLSVEDLIRTEISNLKLDNLKEEEWKYLSEKEIEELKRN